MFSHGAARYDSGMSHFAGSRPPPDQVLVDIVDYVRGDAPSGALARETARYCLLDTLGCGLEALEYPACTRLLGPLVPGTRAPPTIVAPGTTGPRSRVQAGYLSA